MATARVQWRHHKCHGYVYIRVSGLGCPEWLISSLSAAASGVAGVGMFVSVVYVSVSDVFRRSPWVGRRGRARGPNATHSGRHGSHGPHGPETRKFFSFQGPMGPM